MQDDTDVSVATTPPSDIEEIDIGPAVQDSQVTPITVAGRHCFLIRNSDRVRLLSTTCPHMGGEVRDVGDRFECPLHGWTFDKSTGRCLNAASAALSEIETITRHGRVYARIARKHHRTFAATKSLAKADLSIELIAHSSLQIRVGSFTLITDPWLNGPAMLGSWTQYPPPLVQACDLRPNAVWISHEHSDHFHEPTLAQFDRKTPIYFPDFPNQRLPQRLTALGFRNIHPMPFGQRISITQNFALTCFEPASLWNDAIVLIELDNFRVLNLNDAGLNRRIASIIGPVDAVASAFTPGASGYPLTWTHLTEPQQDAILEKSCTGMLQMLRDAVQLYDCALLIPYAGHFALWHPEHRRHVQRMKKNSLGDVKTALADLPVQVIDLLPGDSWHPATSRIKRSSNGYERDLGKYLDQTFDEAIFQQRHGQDANLTPESLDAHFLRLNDVPEIVFCEDLIVQIAVTDISLNQTHFERRYEIRGGKITAVPIDSSAPNLTMRIPITVLARIVQDDLSWDESHIGYWCGFSRSPDIFHGGFWRLLQAPYYRRPVGSLPKPLNKKIAPETSVAEIVQTLGPSAERILRRYGMYCGGCHRATAESISQAAAVHGIDPNQTQRLIDELNAALI